MIPHVNLSISGYEPDSLRTSSMRSPFMQAQEASAIPQLDGPGSLPMRDPMEDGCMESLGQSSETPPKETHTCKGLL